MDCKQDDVNFVLKYVMDSFKGTNSFVILDDCASWQDVKNRTSQFVDLDFSARHYGLSVIVLTQRLASIAKPYKTRKI